MRPGDTFLSISGKPYDTLLEVIDGGDGSLKDYGINFDCIELKNNAFDKEKISDYLKNNSPKLIFMQRSRGYEWRNALTIEEIESITDFCALKAFAARFTWITVTANSSKKENRPKSA